MCAAACGSKPIARDRRRRTTGASLSRRGRSRRGLCDGVLGGLGLRPADGCGAGVWQVGATVRPFQKRYAHGGMAALGREDGWRRGRRRISRKRLRIIETLKSQGMSNRAIAHRLGVSENAIRKLVGPSKPAESAQLALPAIATAAEEPAATPVPSTSRAAKMEIAPLNRRRRTQVITIRPSRQRLRTTMSRHR